MFLLKRLTRGLYPQQLKHLKMSQIGELGSGAGKGGGGGGAIREAGGSFGKMEAAREEEYFHKQQREQLMKLKNKTSATDKSSNESTK